MMKTVAIASGVVLVVGGVGLTIYMFLGRPTAKLGNDFNVFDDYKVEDESVTPNTTLMACKEKCVADPNCKALSFDTVGNNCIITGKDPYKTASVEPKWQIYIRRPVGEAASSWGPWVKECPPCGEKSDMEITRVCKGPRCLGPTKRECHVGACYDVFAGLHL